VAPSTAPTAPTASIAPAFAAITLQAADPKNVRNGARVIECGTCVGGDRVGYIGGPNFLIVRVEGVPVAGERTLTVVYECSGPRTLMIRVNDAAVRTLSLDGAGDVIIPAVTTLPVFIPGGTSLIRFFNDTGSAPDIDRIVIS
jgi:hypothetical protein